MSARQKIMTQPIVRAAAVAGASAPRSLARPGSRPSSPRAFPLLYPSQFDCYLACYVSLERISATLATQNLIFRYLQSKAEIEIWLFEQTDMRIRGRIIVSWRHSVQRARACARASSLSRSLQGFDEYMNMVLADAKEVSLKKKTEKPLGARLTSRVPNGPSTMTASRLPSFSSLDFPALNCVCLVSRRRTDPSERGKYRANAGNVSPDALPFFLLWA